VRDVAGQRGEAFEGIAVDVEVRWGGDLLAVRRLAAGERATVGDAPDSLVALPCEALGIDAFAFAETYADGRAAALLPRGARGRLERSGQPTAIVAGPRELPLEAGDRVRLVLGAFTLIVAAGAEDAGSNRRRPARPSGARALGIAAVGHALVLAISSVVAPALPSSALEPDASATSVRGLVLAAEQRAELDLPAGPAPRVASSAVARGAWAPGSAGRARLFGEGLGALVALVGLPFGASPDLGPSLLALAAIVDRQG
jgi:hypothetical protein